MNFDGCLGITSWSWLTNVHPQQENETLWRLWSRWKLEVKKIRNAEVRVGIWK
ncbi:hypothetical protein YC2023_090789 [Brassica napus]